MADNVKERDNRDAESGRPVELDPEQHDGKTGEKDKSKQHPKQGVHHDDKPGQQPHR